MIGSRQGWLEAPYVPCPASIDHLAQKFVSLTTKKGCRVAIVPGVSTENSAGVPDVIRGEETQIIGALKPTEMQSLFVLPGAHSKWVSVEENRITQFATFMTGEIFAVLCEHSILARTMQGNADDVEWFKQGHDYAMNKNVNQVGLLLTFVRHGQKAHGLMALGHLGPAPGYWLSKASTWNGKLVLRSRPIPLSVDCPYKTAGFVLQCA